MAHKRVVENFDIDDAQILRLWQDESQQDLAVRDYEAWVNEVTGSPLLISGTPQLERFSNQPCTQAKAGEYDISAMSDHQLERSSFCGETRTSQATHVKQPILPREEWSYEGTEMHSSGLSGLISQGFLHPSSTCFPLVTAYVDKQDTEAPPSCSGYSSRSSAGGAQSYQSPELDFQLGTPKTYSLPNSTTASLAPKDKPRLTLKRPTSELDDKLSDGHIEDVELEPKKRRNRDSHSLSEGMYRDRIASKIITLKQLLLKGDKSRSARTGTSLVCQDAEKWTKTVLLQKVIDYVQRLEAENADLAHKVANMERLL